MSNNSTGPITQHLAVATQNYANDLVAGVRGLTTTDERGEGVISAAIAVLIFALIGSAMWVAYRKLFQTSSDKTAKVVEDIANTVAN
jgi:hypothetical protein